MNVHPTPVQDVNVLLLFTVPDGNTLTHLTTAQEESVIGLPNAVPLTEDMVVPPSAALPTVVGTDAIVVVVQTVVGTDVIVVVQTVVGTDVIVTVQTVVGTDVDT